PGIPGIPGIPGSGRRGSEAEGPVSGDPVSKSLEFTAKRVELILQQLEALPTLSGVAVRLLELTSHDDSQSKDVISLISSDPALAAKILKMCRGSDRGKAVHVTSVERAVRLLGYDAVRSAALSVQVFELFDAVESPGGEKRGTSAVFDRATFWRHSLAVACVCEALAGTAGVCRNINKTDAFASGLLHDLGMLALHVLLPLSFDRVCQYAQAHGVSMDHACRKMLGMDVHTAGRRLAEHWRLPHSLGDVLWLHGQRWDSLPDLPHRGQIALVSLADAVARSQGIAPVGHGPRGEDIKDICNQLGISYSLVDDLIATLQKDVAERAGTMGLNVQADPGVLLGALSRANEALGRINAGMRHRAVLAHRQSETLKAITHFHDSASPGGSVVTVIGKVVQSAAGVFGGGFFASLYQVKIDDPWQLIQFSTDGRPLRSELIVPPPGSTAVSDLADNTQVSMQALELLPWLSKYIEKARGLRDVQLLPLRCGWGVNAVLLHDCQIDGREAREQLDALGRTWAAAIAAGAQHEGAKRLGEQLAESNRALVDTKDELARTQALAALGEIAAGAAHEMNNPLTVISGRSQLLVQKLKDAELRMMAEQVVEQSHKISDMITALRMFSEPTRPTVESTNLSELLDVLVADVRKRYESPAAVKVVVEPTIPLVHIDPHQIGRAISELVKNAIESERATHIEVRVQIEGPDDRLKIQVSDNGSGLTAHTLAHAFDPFFSAKSAGRQPGLGLAQARRLVEAHGGQITLENGRKGGAVATIRLDRWRGPAQQQEQRREVA
ncbi:MAG: HDOD domain-containing protein, partial [Phycisphaerales bacterium]|nr:HDOD domain-containing protein [Phycisphaerales bacterium]MCI0675393.1 HDOD domain-containing protein [Phycisphaerales bacterium]